MADSKVGPASNPSPEQERAQANVRTKEELYRRTEGLRPDFDGQTPISDEKSPNVFDRAKEEFEAIEQAIHPNKDHDPPKPDYSHSSAKLESKSESLDSEKSKKSHCLIEKAKESLIDELQKKKRTHHKETHGRSDDIDETTPIDEIKGPNLFERAKEEFEALIEAIHPKKDTRRVISSKKHEGGLGASVGKTLEKICSPRGHKETHGMSDDIDETTPIDEIKGPNVFERAKEEVEAIIGAIHPKKDVRRGISSSKDEDGLGASGKKVGKYLLSRGP